MLGRVAASSSQSSRERAPALPGRRQRPRELGLAVRQGPLRLRGGEQRATASAQARSSPGRRAAAGHVVGALARPQPRSDAARPRAARAIARPRRSPGTNEDAYAWAKLAKGVLGTDNVDAQLGDGLDPRGPAGAAASHDRRGVRRLDRRPARSRPEGGAAGPVPAAARRRREARRTRLVELAATRHRPHAVRLEEPAAPTGGRAGRASVPRAPRRRSPRRTPRRLRDQLGAKGTVVVVGGRASLAESAAVTVDAVAALHAAVPSGQVPGRRCAAATSTARSTWVSRPGCCRAASGWPRPVSALRAAWPSLPGARPRCRRHPRAAADGRIGCLVLLGADPVSDFPDRDLARRGARRARHDRRRRHLPQRVVQTGRRRARRRGVRREGRAPPPTSRGGSAPSARRSRRPAPRHADWIIAADLAARLGHDLGLGSVEEIWDEIARGRHRATPASRPSALAGDHDGVVTRLAGQRRSLADATTGAPPLKGYGLRLAVGRRLYDAGVAVTQSPSLAGLCRRRAAPEPVGRRPPRRARRHGGPGGVAEGPRSCLPIVRDRWRAPRARPGWRSNQPDAGGQPPRRRRRRPSTTSRWPPSPDQCTGAD